MRRRPPPIVRALLHPALAALLLLLAGLAFWADLDPAGRALAARLVTGERAAMVALILVPALAALGYWSHRDASAAHAAAARIAEGVRVIARVNPAQRLASPGGTDAAGIVEAVNELAQLRAGLLEDAQAAAQQARKVVEDERNRLAALISELDQSVLVCNREGRILLYNAAVSRLLGAGSAVQIGLGRSAFAILDRDLVLHAIDTLESHAAQGERRNVQFVAAAPDGRMLRVSVAPVLASAQAPGAAPGGPLNGFVLLLADVTESVEGDARSVALVQELVEGARSAIAGIQGALGELTDPGDLDAGRRGRIAATVRGETARLSARIDVLSADVAQRLRRRWPLEEVRGADLVALACRHIARRHGLAAEPEQVDARLWLRVDSFTLVQAIASLAGRLREEFAVRDVRLRLSGEGEAAHLELAWKGVPMSSETAFNWQNDTFTLGGEQNPVSLAQVMERHGGEAWYRREAPSQTNYFRLRLPLAPQRTAAPAAPRTAMRPEFYDFDLFSHSPATDALDARRLGDITFTVFDTETTGLSPSEGDEIISIGAVRIVNGRLLRSETFEALVDPRRPVSPASIAIHGITPEILEGAPPIGAVLPRFWRFAEDTVLVGHNAAFDMRFLQLKEAACGVRFVQPVLDTLLLAAVVHPSEPSQSLESIAGRLGIGVIGRHTALGDALATAEVFLALVPLLAAQGIHTLGDARAASERTLYARLQY